MRSKKQYFVWTMMIIFFSTILLYAHATGITGVTRKNGDGCTCHSASPSSNVSVVISGPDILAPGATGSYMVVITGGPLIAGGTDIAASSGTLIPGEGLQKIGDELTHTQPKQSSAGSVVFTFTFMAPTETGPVTLFANGNSVNLNGLNSGDEWNFADNKTITVTAATGVEDGSNLLTFNMDQNYPNPFNPSTRINFRIPGDVSGELVTLKIYDVLGNESATPVNEPMSAGDYNIDFNASDLPSGVYIYELKAGRYSSVRKMILAK